MTLHFEDLRDILTEEEYAAAEKARVHPKAQSSFHSYASLILHTFTWNKTPGFSVEHWKNKHAKLFLM